MKDKIVWKFPNAIVSCEWLSKNLNKSITFKEQ